MLNYFLFLQKRSKKIKNDKKRSKMIKNDQNMFKNGEKNNNK